MRILIDKALRHFYMLWESLLLYKQGNILLSLTLKENRISTIFTVNILKKNLPKGRALMKLYRVVPQTKRGNSSINVKLDSTDQFILYAYLMMCCFYSYVIVYS